MALKTDAVSGALVGVGASATGAAIGILLIAGASEDAIFALIGALIGATATVAGAAWLADRNAHVERAAELTLLIREYEPLLRLATAALDAAPASSFPEPPGYRDKLRQLTSIAAETTQVTQEALQHATKLTFRQRVHLKRLSKAAASVVQLWQDDNDEFWDRNPEDERNWPDLIGYVRFEVIEALIQLGETHHQSQH